MNIPDVVQHQMRVVAAVRGSLSSASERLTDQIPLEPVVLPDSLEKHQPPRYLQRSTSGLDTRPSSERPESNCCLHLVILPRIAEGSPAADAGRDLHPQSRKRREFTTWRHRKEGAWLCVPSDRWPVAGWEERIPRPLIPFREGEV